MVLLWPSLLSIFASVCSPPCAALSSTVGGGGKWGEKCVPGDLQSTTWLWVLPPTLPLQIPGIQRLQATLKPERSRKSTNLARLWQPPDRVASQKGAGPGGFQTWGGLQSPAATTQSLLASSAPDFRSMLFRAGFDPSPESTKWTEKGGERLVLGMKACKFAFGFP